MERQAVESSSVLSIGYSEPVLEVEFEGGRVYRYAGVPSTVYEDLMHAPSKGRFLNAAIKGRYSFVRVRS